MPLVVNIVFSSLELVFGTSLRRVCSSRGRLWVEVGCGLTLYTAGT